MVHKLVQSRHPFVVRRGNTYYFRYAIPTHIRKLCPALPAEIKRSLRTDSLSDAVYLVSHKIPLIKTLRRCHDVSVIERLCRQLVDFTEQVKGWVNKQLSRLRVEDTAPQVVTPIATKPKPKTPKLSKVWQDFATWKSWTDKKTKDNQRLFDNLIYFLGDVPVEQVTKADLKSALVSISELPQRNKKAYKGLPLSKLSRMVIPEDDLVSSKSVKEHLKLAQSLFSAYLVKEVDVLKASPTEGLKWVVEDNRYAALNDAQVRDVLSRSKSKPEWFRWFLLLAVYTGARRSELAKLRPCDFKLCSDTGRYYFVISEGKTKAARRMVPVHKELIELGLLRWIGGGSELIFPVAATTPNRVTENFSSLLSDRLNDLGERIVFHSCRHTFITKARAAGVSNVLVQQVVGHEKSGAGQADRYTHGFLLKDVLEVVDVVEY